MLFRKLHFKTNKGGHLSVSASFLLHSLFDLCVDPLPQSMQIRIIPGVSGERQLFLQALGNDGFHGVSASQLFQQLQRPHILDTLPEHHVPDGFQRLSLLAGLDDEGITGGEGIAAVCHGKGIDLLPGQNRVVEVEAPLQETGDLVPVQLYTQDAGTA